MGRQRDAALIFCFVLHQGKMNWSEAEIGGAKYKPDGTLDKIERFYPTIIALTTDWYSHIIQTAS